MGTRDTTMAGIPMKKADFRICGGCCIPACYSQNNYVKPPECTVQAESMYCCFATDCGGSCCQLGDDIPPICGTLGIVCCPHCKMCPTVKALFEDNPQALAELADTKEEFCVCAGCCLGKCARMNTYCTKPTTCCKQESEACCCAGDCAFPANDDVPQACNFYGCHFCPKGFACCPKVADLYAMEGGGAPSADGGAA